MLKVEVNKVVSKFYDEDYFRNYYVMWVMEEICDLPFEFGWDWNEYHGYETYLDDIYADNK